MSQRTIYLARLFGLFLMVTAVWMLADEPGVNLTVQALFHDRPAMLLFSLLCVTAGLAMVLGHQVWTGGIAPILVTLLGWLLLARGILLLFIPHNTLEALVAAIAGPVALYASGAIALGVGAFLTYAGFRAPLIVSGRPQAMDR